MSDSWGSSWSAGSSPCVDGICGTGEWSGALPGDPDNNSILSATATSGGIDVSWTYPINNAFAVIHTRLYRGVTNVFTNAVFQKIVAGNFYYDRIPADEIREYFYWIELVSVNSTVGAPIGPASATPIPAIEGIMQELTGLIDSGVLAQSLRSEIQEIQLLRGDLSAESLTRFQNNEALAEALAEVLSETGEAKAILLEEITQRTNAEEALLSQLNVLAVGMNNNLAAIVEERTVRATAIEAYADSLDVVVSRVDTAAAAIQNEKTTRASADSALSNQITTAQASLGNNLASVQTTLETKITSVDGKKNNLGALYMTKVNVNDVGGGFGIYNNGIYVESGFDVDRFWIGRTLANRVKPFIVDNGVTYIDKARIRNADIDTLKIAGNAVTVPTSATGFGSIPGVYVTLSEPGVIQVAVMCNWTAENLTSCSGFLRAYGGGVGSVEIGVSMPTGYSGSATAFGSFALPAGTHYCTGVSRIVGGDRIISGTHISVLGIKR